jgi:hypothetical protein
MVEVVQVPGKEPGWLWLGVVMEVGRRQRMVLSTDTSELKRKRLAASRQSSPQTLGHPHHPRPPCFATSPPSPHAHAAPLLSRESFSPSTPATIRDHLTPPEHYYAMGPWAIIRPKGLFSRPHTLRASALQFGSCIKPARPPLVSLGAAERPHALPWLCYTTDHRAEYGPLMCTSTS